MVKRIHIQGKANRDSSPISRQDQFASRPFNSPEPSGDKPATRAPERAPCCMSFADIDIMPRTVVQPKLALGPAGDRYEREADLVARQVVTAISSEKSAVSEFERSNPVQRISAPSRLLPLHKGPHVAPETEASIRQARSGGQALPDDVRAPMERAFVADFSGVRVHADGRADRLNRSLQARAFTTGQDIFLRQGEYRPGSSEGRRLLAHEMAHVVQQSGGSHQIQRRVDQPVAPIANSSIVSEAIERSGGVISPAYNYIPGWWYSPNSDLAGWRSRPSQQEVRQGAQNPPPEGEGIVNWGAGFPHAIFSFTMSSMRQVSSRPCRATGIITVQGRRTIDPVLFDPILVS